MWPLKKRSKASTQRSLAAAVLDNPSILNSVIPDPKIEAKIQELNANDKQVRLNEVEYLGKITLPNTRAIIALAVAARTNSSETVRQKAKLYILLSGIDANDVMTQVNETLDRRQ